jgi:hypothetical protein
LVVFLHKAGDYLVFFRVPAKSSPADYVDLQGHFMLYGIQDKEKGYALVWENSLPASNANLATTPGLYVWCTLHWDDQKLIMDRTKLQANIPPELKRLNGAAPMPSPSVPGFSFPGFTPSH